MAHAVQIVQIKGLHWLHSQSVSTFYTDSSLRWCRRGSSSPGYTYVSGGSRNFKGWGADGCQPWRHLSQIRIMNYIMRCTRKKRLDHWKKHA